MGADGKSTTARNEATAEYLSLRLLSLFSASILSVGTRRSRSLPENAKKYSQRLKKLSDIGRFVFEEVRVDKFDVDGVLRRNGIEDLTQNGINSFLRNIRSKNRIP